MEHDPSRPEGDGVPYHLLATASLADDRTRVLKHGDTCVVFDHLGNVKPGGLGKEGLYHEGTRYLSCLVLELDGLPPFFLGSTVRDQNDQLSVALTNPDRILDGRVEVPLGTLHLAVRTLLWQGTCHWELRARNHGPDPVEASICLRFRADFADIFEVRGMRREARGSDLLPDLAPGRVTLGYVVHRLCHHPLLRDLSLVWPFETAFTSAPAFGRRPLVLHAEIWPGVVDQQVKTLTAADPQLITDQAQVRALCLWADAQDAAGTLEPFFGQPASMSTGDLGRGVNEEGWILGTS